MSNEQKKYLIKIRREKLLVRLSQLLIILITLVTWELLVNKNIINGFIFSSPTRIISTIKELYINNMLFIHIYITLKEVIISFIIGTLISFILALLLYEFKFIAKVVDPFLTMLNSLPKVALGPLIIILFGSNINSIIIMAILISSIVSLMTFYNGFINTDYYKLKLLESFKSNKWQILKYLVIPSSYSTIITSLKLNISLTLIGVIMGEFLVSKSGIGYLIVYGKQIFNLDYVMTGVLLLAIISYIIYKIINWLEKRLLKNI